MRTRDASKEQLVKDKAIDMLVTGGFEGFSMNKLAKACNISVATLYIYYKDKDDLIVTIAREEGRRMTEIMLKDFDPEQSFAEGMRMQWKNRFAYMMDSPVPMKFFEQLRTSSYNDRVEETVTDNFKDAMWRFLTNAIERGELKQMPIEVFWSVAYAPLYSLVRFHNEGRSIGGKPFTITEEILWHTFDLVVKGLTP